MYSSLHTCSLKKLKSLLVFVMIPWGISALEIYNTIYTILCSGQELG